MPKTDEICDCGHTPTPSNASAGYAKTASGWTMCYPCADAAQLEDLLTEDHYFAYLSGDGRTITTWTGGELMIVTASWKRANNFAGEITWINARDPHGQDWYGSSPGPNMYARLHKSNA